MDSLTQADLRRFVGKLNIYISNTFYNGERCWEWMAGKDSDGYGGFFLSGKNEKAHRVAWMFRFGEIPEGLGVLHHCDNPGCVNPLHLFLGDHKTNMGDKAQKGRHGNTGIRYKK